MFIYFIIFILFIILINYLFIFFNIVIILNYSFNLSDELDDWDELFSLYSYSNEHFTYHNILELIFTQSNKVSEDTFDFFTLFYIILIIIIQFFFGIIPYYRDYESYYYFKDQVGLYLSNLQGLTLSTEKNIYFNKYKYKYLNSINFFANRFYILQNVESVERLKFQKFLQLNFYFKKLQNINYMILGKKFIFDLDLKNKFVSNNQYLNMLKIFVQKYSNYFSFNKFKNLNNLFFTSLKRNYISLPIYNSNLYLNNNNLKFQKFYYLKYINKLKMTGFLLFNDFCTTFVMNQYLNLIPLNKIYTYEEYSGKLFNIFGLDITQWHEPYNLNNLFDEDLMNSMKALFPIFFLNNDISFYNYDIDKYGNIEILLQDNFFVNNFNDSYTQVDPDDQFRDFFEFLPGEFFEEYGNYPNFIDPNYFFRLKLSNYEFAKLGTPYYNYKYNTEDNDLGILNLFNIFIENRNLQKSSFIYRKYLNFLLKNLKFKQTFIKTFHTNVYYYFYCQKYGYTKPKYYYKKSFYLFKFNRFIPVIKDPRWIYGYFYKNLFIERFFKLLDQILLSKKKEKYNEYWKSLYFSKQLNFLFYKYIFYKYFTYKTFNKKINETMVLMPMSYSLFKYLRMIYNIVDIKFYTYITRAEVDITKIKNAAILIPLPKPRIEIMIQNYTKIINDFLYNYFWKIRNFGFTKFLRFKQPYATLLGKILDLNRFFQDYRFYKVLPMFSRSFYKYEKFALKLNIFPWNFYCRHSIIYFSKKSLNSFYSHWPRFTFGRIHHLSVYLHNYDFMKSNDLYTLHLIHKEYYKKRWENFLIFKFWENLENIIGKWYYYYFYYPITFPFNILNKIFFYLLKFNKHYCLRLMDAYLIFYLKFKNPYYNYFYNENTKYYKFLWSFNFYNPLVFNNYSKYYFKNRTFYWDKYRPSNELMLLINNTYTMNPESKTPSNYAAYTTAINEISTKFFFFKKKNYLFLPKQNKLEVFPRDYEYNYKFYFMNKNNIKTKSFYLKELWLTSQFNLIRKQISIYYSRELLRYIQYKNIDFISTCNLYNKSFKNDQVFYILLDFNRYYDVKIVDKNSVILIECGYFDFFNFLQLYYLNDLFFFYIVKIILFYL